MKALAHWQVLLQNLLRLALAPVVLASHRVDWIYKKGEENRYRVCEDREAQKIEAVASIDVFEARALGWYL